MKKKMRLIILISTLIIGIITTPSTIGLKLDNYNTMNINPSGNTLYVGGSEPGNYSRIQDAIDAASNNDTVFIFDDSSPYFENVIVNKQISLIGENRDTTIVDGNDKGDVILIKVDNVIISNLNIQNCKEDWTHAGIKIQTNNNKIINNNFLYNYRNEIIISGSNYNIIENNNIISDSYHGIVVEKQTHDNIISNNLIKNHFVGVMIWGDSYHTIIIDNFIEKNSYNIRTYSDYTKISNNTISKGGVGLNLHGTRYNLIENNIFIKKGIVFEGSKFNIINNNTINGKPLLYLENVSNKTIDFDTGQIILINCDFIKIENQVIIDTDIGITVSKSRNCQIINCNFSKNTLHGLQISGSSDITLSKSNLLSNGAFGIEIIGSNEITIFENIINNNVRGITLDSGSKNILIENNDISFNKDDGLEIRGPRIRIIKNNISNNEKGINLISSGNRITISDNTFCSNINYAIGFDFYQSNNYISNNIIKNCEKGISINGKNNTVINNHFENNELGIYASSCDECSFKKNNFIDNDKHANFFYYGSFERTKTNKWKGNYWQKPRIFPYIIFGKVEIRIQFDEYITINWFQIDWFPAKAPYDIGVNI
jgi:parallel beta-helix repeat protein